MVNRVAMRKFFKTMLSSSSDVSSKRFAALISLFCVIILTFMATFRAERWVTPEFMFEALTLIAGAGLGMTVIENYLTNKTNNQNKAKGGCDEEPPIDSNTTNNGDGNDIIQ